MVKKITASVVSLALIILPASLWAGQTAPTAAKKWDPLDRQVSKVKAQKYVNKDGRKVYKATDGKEYLLDKSGSRYMVDQYGNKVQMDKAGNMIVMDPKRRVNIRIGPGPVC